ncbi:MAG: exodeoxyribonuclease VII large subunit, partial [Bdellovibrionales bacterium]|nr:exodeoxyribonuclease VII large subunit [Bdellovibrionales bacterium]
DMLNVLSRRFKGLQITVIPVLVQGDKAAPSIVEGIRKANLLPTVDVLIVGRGGGSIEDLWAFNEEIVARAIAESKKPVISAVGHEVDFTIADFVADLRAPTPSAAAELVVQNAEELLQRVQLHKKRLWTAFYALLKSKQQKFQHLQQRLTDPRRRLQDLILRCDELTQRLEFSMVRQVQYLRTQVQLVAQKLGQPLENIKKVRQQLNYIHSQLRTKMEYKIERKKSELNKNMVLLDSLSPLCVVDRGYSIVTHQGQVVKSTSQIKPGEKVNLRFAKGEAQAVIETIK